VLASFGLADNRGISARRGAAARPVIPGVSWLWPWGSALRARDNPLKYLELTRLASRFTSVGSTDNFSRKVDNEHFDLVVGRLNGWANRSPALYRTAVLAFAVLGYAVYLLLMLVALGVVAAMGVLLFLKPNIWLIKIGWKLGIPLVAFVWVMLKALKVTLPVPQGMSVTRAQTPALFELIDRVSQQLAVPRMERVLLTHEYNASVVQLPRFGFFGITNYLMLGVPLLQALSKEDATAVIAHEFGHLSGNHSRFSGWIYRSVRSYEQVLEATGDNKLLHAFLNWYVPRLEALSFPLRRQNEYEADAASGEVVGKQRAGQALTNVHVRGAFEDDFWKGVKRGVRVSPHPPAQLFFDWEKQLNGVPAETEQHALQQVLAERSANTDTHPSLTERLAKLGIEGRLEAAPLLSAAHTLLGDSRAYYVEQAGFQWSGRVAEGWRAEHARLVQAAERVTALETERTTRALSADEAFEYADLVEDVRPEQDALPLFKAVLELEPDHLPARFAIGRVLLSRDDEAGTDLMKPLANHPEPQLRLSANALLAGFYARRGEHGVAEAHIADLRAAHQKQAEKERAHTELTVDDTFAPHELEPAKLAELARDLALFPGVAHALVVRKLVEGEFAGFVVALELTLKQRLMDNDTLVERVVNTLTLPGATWCIRLDENAQFKVVLEEVAGARVKPAA